MPTLDACAGWLVLEVPHASPAVITVIVECIVTTRASARLEVIREEQGINLIRIAPKSFHSPCMGKLHP